MVRLCPACQSDDLLPAFPIELWLDVHREDSALSGFVTAMKAHENYGIEKFCRCGGCGFLFARPYPSREALTQFYADYYANENYAGKIASKLKRAGRRIRKLRRARDKTFLDVGCNIGTAVEAARRAGLKATGIEIDPVAVREAQRIFPENRYVVSSVQDFDEGLYDIIYTTEVIEHLPDIDGFAAGLYRRLAPGGVLYLTTPDAGHFRVPRDVCRWKEVKLPEHISLFSGKAIKALLKRHGFQNIRLRFNVKPGIRLTAYKERN